MEGFNRYDSQSLSILHALHCLTKLEIRNFSHLALLPLTRPEPVWPMLEELVLLSIDLDDPDNSIVQLFRGLTRKWGTTLKALRLDFGAARPGPHFSSLSLTRLEKLELTWVNCINLEFLLPCKDSLKDLFIYMCADEGILDWQRAKDSEQTIRVLSCTRHLFESNVWSIFPALERVCLEVIGIPDGRCRNKYGSRNGWRKWRRIQSEMGKLKKLRVTLREIFWKGINCCLR